MENFGQAMSILACTASDVIEKVSKQFSLNDFHAWDTYNRQNSWNNFQEVQCRLFLAIKTLLVKSIH